MGWLCVTIDMDGPFEYSALHGVHSVNVDGQMMYRGPLQRFVALMQELGVHATLFVVGRDLHGYAREALTDLLACGHEVGNHSHTHNYRLSGYPTPRIREDINRAHSAFRSELGVTPVGFRAPGHQVTPGILDVLQFLHYRYDTSVFPSPAYYGLKAVALLSYKARLRRSNALQGTPRMALAPRLPYRPGTDPHAVGERDIIELPTAVSRILRLPMTGAAFALMPAWLRHRCIESVHGEPAVVLNFHAMDFVDATSDALPERLVSLQPELRVPIHHRLTIYRDALERLVRQRRGITCRALLETREVGDSLDKRWRVG